MPQPVFRFAPSPNGRLHLGHAYSALLNMQMAREAGGRVLLRIEDTDIVRCTPAHERAMIEDLEWIGFEWDGEPRRQSEHLQTYLKSAQELRERGLAYPAFMSRREIANAIEKAGQSGMDWPRDPDGAPFYPGDERSWTQDRLEARIAAGDAHALRLDIEHAAAIPAQQLSWEETGYGPNGETGIIEATPQAWGDVVLSRKDVPASYHLACVVDDALQGITCVVRGRDLFHATSIQRLLQELLGLSPPSYHHHDLILDSDGSKLSKSRGDTSLAELRRAGCTPADIRAMIGL